METRTGSAILRDLKQNEADEPQLGTPIFVLALALIMFGLCAMAAAPVIMLIAIILFGSSVTIIALRLSEGRRSR